MSLVSMTGFGRGQATAGTRRIVAELRAVNHRFLELKLRLGRDDGELEAELGKLVRARLHRGAVSLSVREESDEAAGDQAPPSALVDEARASHWMATLTLLGNRLGTPPPTLDLVCSQQGVIRSRAEELPRAQLVEASRGAVLGALEALCEARTREGAVLTDELRSRVEALAALRAEVGRLAEGEPAAHAERLSARLSALLEGRGTLVEPQRLAQEVALLAERLDVTEELVRLGAHLDEARRLLASDQPTGRKLDFLAQELHREINTIGSKAQSAEIAARIVEMKAELERFREQVQNVE